MSHRLSERPTERAEQLPMIIRAMAVVERVGNALPHPFWLFWILVVLLGASAFLLLIACSNVANLILARSVRREGELAVRAALGASRGALRRTLLAESLVLCGAGAVLGVMLARPMVAVVASFAAPASSGRG